MNPYLVLDIETQRSADEVPGGWYSIQDFGLTIAVTMFASDYGTYPMYFKDETAIEQVYYTDELNDRYPILTTKVLIESLYQTPLIITFNGIRFDYEVLRPYGLKPEFLYHKSFDILVEMQKILGHRVSLESVAQATLGEGKSGSGIQAIKWYKEGKIDKIIEYCQKDVDITRRIYEFIQTHSYVQYMSLSGEVRTCKINSPAKEVILSPQRK
jgi:DEAD/DEAH box helicase domain-containing protein